MTPKELKSEHSYMRRLQQSSRPTLRDAFAKLTYSERQLLTCALAGNHPERLAHLRPELIRALADVENPAFGCCS